LELAQKGRWEKKEAFNTPQRGKNAEKIRRGKVECIPIKGEKANVSYTGEKKEKGEKRGKAVSEERNGIGKLVREGRFGNTYSSKRKKRK